MKKPKIGTILHRAEIKRKWDGSHLLIFTNWKVFEHTPKGIKVALQNQEFGKQKIKWMRWPPADRAWARPMKHEAASDALIRAERYIKHCERRLKEARERYAAVCDEIGEPVDFNSDGYLKIGTVLYHQTGGNVGLRWTVIPDGVPPNDGEAVYIKGD